MPALQVLSVPPVAALQDLGRTGLRAMGVSRGGAMDRAALRDAAALLDQPVTAALELAGPGARFRVRGDLRLALTGAPMRASADGALLRWQACHALTDGAELTLTPGRDGLYAYLTVGGGFDAPPILGSRSVNMLAGIGTPVVPGELLPAGPDPQPGRAGLALPAERRDAAGSIRVLDGPQTRLFDAATRARFFASDFRVDPRSNRQGVRLIRPGASFHTDTQLSILSEAIVPGDIQLTGDGTPYVLMPDCQTTGGYPRIGTVHPDDLGRVAQTLPGQSIRFQPVARDAALAAFRAARQGEGQLAAACRPLIRDPSDVKDLLSYQLVSGVTDGDDVTP